MLRAVVPLLTFVITVITVHDKLIVSYTFEMASWSKLEYWNNWLQQCGGASDEKKCFYFKPLAHTTPCIFYVAGWTAASLLKSREIGC